MSNVKKTHRQNASEIHRGDTRLTDLSPADLERVSGAGCWYDGVSAGGGGGKYFHGGYPPEH